MDVKTIGTILVTILAATGSAFGHSISPADQSQLSTGLTDIATGVTMIMPIFTAIFHALHVKKLTANSSNPLSQKAS